MRRAPARPVRACFVRSCCSVVVQEHDVCATPAQCNAKRTFSSHFTVHASLPALRTSHLHFALDISSHPKSRELFSPHLSSSHLVPSLLTCHLSKFYSTAFISSEHWSTFLISLKLFSTHLSCSARQKALTVSAQKLETQMHLHFTQEKPLESIFVLQSLAHLPSSSVSQKSSVNTQSSCANNTPRPYYIYSILVTHARCSCIAAKLNYSISYVNDNLSIEHTHTVQRQQLHAFFSIALCLGFGSSSPTLAQKAGQRDPQTLVGGLGACHGTSRSKSGKMFSPSAMTLRTQAASACDKRHPAPTRQAFSKVAAACTPSSARARQWCSAKVSSCSVQTVAKASKQRAQSPYLK